MSTGHRVVNMIGKGRLFGRNYVVYNPTTKKYYVGPTTVAGAPSIAITDNIDEAMGFAKKTEVPEVFTNRSRDNRSRRKIPGWIIKDLNEPCPEQ